MKTLIKTALSSAVVISSAVMANHLTGSLPVMYTSPDLDGSGPGVMASDEPFASGEIVGNLELSLASIFDLPGELVRNAGAGERLDGLMAAGFNQQEMENVGLGFGLAMDAIGAAFVNQLSGANIYTPFDDSVLVQLQTTDLGDVTNYHFTMGQDLDVCTGDASSCVVSAEVDLVIQLDSSATSGIENGRDGFGSSWWLSRSAVTLKVNKISVENEWARLEFTNDFSGGAAVVGEERVPPTGMGTADSAAPSAPIAQTSASPSLPADSSSSSSSSELPEGISPPPPLGDSEPVYPTPAEAIVLNGFNLRFELDEDGYLSGGEFSAGSSIISLGANAVTVDAEGEIDAFVTLIYGELGGLNYAYKNESTNLDTVTLADASLLMEMVFLENNWDITFEEMSIWGMGFGGTPNAVGEPGSSQSHSSSSAVSSQPNLGSESSASSASLSNAPGDSPATEEPVKRGGATFIIPFLLFGMMIFACGRRGLG